ncbi:hypothetical protein AX16_001518 [Volvariella volvacea WC 439]|nr:hypothetical protein AX16_001518 [Volvariella volvacea WC 439]
MPIEMQAEFHRLIATLGMPLYLHDTRYGLWDFMHERIVRCTNTKPELYGKLILLQHTEGLHRLQFLSGPDTANSQDDAGVVDAGVVDPALLLAYYESARSLPVDQLKLQIERILDTLKSQPDSLRKMLLYLHKVSTFVAGASCISNSRTQPLAHPPSASHVYGELADPTTAHSDVPHRLLEETR